MLGEFISGGLVVVLGYAYPAFECFKTMEKNRVEKEELRFWCQYWIIVAVVTSLDICLKWLPMYGELKLAFFIYLWFPKTKGSGLVYDTLLKPVISAHETDIDRNFQELRARAWDLAIYYWENCADFGQSTFLKMVQYIAAQSGKFTKSKKKKEETEDPWPYPTSAAAPPSPPPPPSPTGSSPLFRRSPDRHKQPSDRKRQPIIPIPFSSAKRNVPPSPRSDVVQAHLHSQTGFLHTYVDPDLNSYRRIRVSK